MKVCRVGAPFASGLAPATLYEAWMTTLPAWAELLPAVSVTPESMPLLSNLTIKVFARTVSRVESNAGCCPLGIGRVNVRRRLPLVLGSRNAGK